MPPSGSAPDRAIDLARALAARAVYEAGTIAGPWPSVALPVARWRGHGEPLDERTELVVEGFPRSSNTLAVMLIGAAQPEGIRIAHHVHAPAQVIEAIRRHLPTLVLIREPERAVVELALRKPALTVGQALRGWVRFYGPLEGRRDDFVAARAAEIPDGLSHVVRRLNERFGTAFREPEIGSDALERAEAAMAAYWEGRSGPGLPLVGRTDVPEPAEEDERRALHRTYAERRLARLRERAERLHETFTNGLPDLGGSAEDRL